VAGASPNVQEESCRQTHEMHQCILQRLARPTRHLSVDPTPCSNPVRAPDHCSSQALPVPQKMKQQFTDNLVESAELSILGAELVRSPVFPMHAPLLVGSPKQETCIH
jgi:hypothetical protein